MFSKKLKSRSAAALPALAIVLIIALTGIIPSGANTATDTPTDLISCPTGYIPTEYTLSVTGVGTASARPDQASISLGIIIRAANASDAVRINAEKMNTIVAALQKLGLSEDVLQTSWYSLYPVYEWDEEKRSSNIVGYEASNTVTVTTTNLTLVGAIIDKATTAGANQIHNINFQLSGEMQKQIEEEAFRKACADAKAQADLIADALGVVVVGVKSVSSSSGSNYPVYVVREIDSYATPQTPTFPGESKVTVTVYVEFLINNTSSVYQTSTQNMSNLAKVNSIDINILESFPVQVHIIARGELPDTATQIDQVLTRRLGNTFYVTITTSRTSDAGTPMIIPFKEIIPLDVYGLSAGTYTVDVNGVSSTFELSIDNIL